MFSMSILTLQCEHILSTDEKRHVLCACALCDAAMRDALTISDECVSTTTTKNHTGFRTGLIGRAHPELAGTAGGSAAGRRGAAGSFSSNKLFEKKSKLCYSLKLEILKLQLKEISARTKQVLQDRSVASRLCLSANNLKNLI